MRKNIKVIGLLGLCLYIMALFLTYAMVYQMDGSRVSTRYTVPILDQPSENLVYYEWEPLEGSPDRGDHVVFLWAGFLAQQPMMYPLMRELTRAGYHVITGDFRGHGESGGEFSMNWLLLLNDYDQIANATQARHPTWNWTHVAVSGHSMGGFASLLFGFSRSNIFTTVAYAPAPYKENVNTTNPKNLCIITGSKDQAFTEGVILDLFQQAVPNAEPGILYGDFASGTAKKMVVIDKARHETELTDDRALSEGVTFIERSFGYLSLSEEYTAHQEFRINAIMIGLFIGVMGVGFLLVFMNGFGKEELKLVSDKETISPLSVESQADFKIDHGPLRTFLTDWILFFFPSVVLAFGMQIISYIFIKDFFANFQILLLGTAGFTSFFVILRHYLRTSRKEMSFGEFLKKMWSRTWKESPLYSLVTGLIAYALSMFLILWGFGQTYMFLFPLNARAISLLFFIPFNFFALMVEMWAFCYYFSEIIRDQKHRFGKFLWGFLLSKYLLLYGIFGIAALFGNTLITIIFLLTIFDFFATIFLVFNYYFNKTHFSIIIYGALLIGTIYLGYSGVINGFEVFFGDPYNIFSWVNLFTFPF